MPQPKERLVRDEKKEEPEPEVNFKTMMDVFLERSSVYALNQIGNSATTARKVFWALVLIFGIVGCIAEVSQFLIVYYKYPIIINVDFISARYQEFPAVTICNLNSIRKKFLPCLENNTISEKCFSATDVTESDIPSVDDNSQLLCKEAELLFSNMTPNYRKKLLSLNFAQRVNYGFQGKDFIKSCRFNGSNCTYNNFSLSDSHNFGNCYTFNSVRERNILFATTSGPYIGLELELDLEVHEYIEDTENVGVRVQIHSPHLDHNIDTEGVNISPGFKTYIGLSRYDSVRLPPPYKDQCRKYEVNDSQALCLFRCLNNLTLSSCSCTLDKTIEQGIPTCDVTNAYVLCCTLRSQKAVESVCDCPLSCHEIKYNSRLSYTEWPSKLHYDENKLDFVNETENTGRGLSLEEIRETRLRLHVHFDTLDYLVYEQNPLYQSLEVLNQIGGQMCLWLGLSIVACFEWAENLIAMCKYKMKDK